ncbi:unnamed protein product [Periconia digitata]|uniref:Uncharacterized protein n=1 Tax=Periconia digitata TaxID=1303443 RepID=A0A9W4UJZ6_9PLEO|nr:unnamed protein product [Periconia digitata]
MLCAPCTFRSGCNRLPCSTCSRCMASHGTHAPLGKPGEKPRSAHPLERLQLRSGPAASVPSSERFLSDTAASRECCMYLVMHSAYTCMYMYSTAQHSTARDSRWTVHHPSDGSTRAECLSRQDTDDGSLESGELRNNRLDHNGDDGQPTCSAADGRRRQPRSIMLEALRVRATALFLICGLELGSTQGTDIGQAAISTNPSCAARTGQDRRRSPCQNVLGGWTCSWPVRF